MIPQKYGAALFAMILSGLMSCLVSGVSTFRMMGLMPEFGHLWLQSWLAAWIFAFPVVLIVAPLARRIVQRVVIKG